MSESRKFIKALERVKFIGHLIKNNEFMTTIINGKIERVRPRKSYIEYINDCMQIGMYCDMKEEALCKKKWL